MVTAKADSPTEQGKNLTALESFDFVHTGPGTLAGRYLRRFWHPVCRAQDLEPRRTRPIKIMSEDLTLYRGESGTPHALAFRCAHRGTQLSAGWVEREDLRCYYHGWKYDPSGQCIEQPGELEPFCNKIRIRSYPTQEYVGLIFAYLGEGEPPPLLRFPELEETDALIENWHEEWPCNYFNRLENGPDLVHVAFVHHHHGGEIAIPLEARETEFGFETIGQGRSVPTRFHMPNMNYFVGQAKAPHLEMGRRHNFMWRVPVDDESHVVFGAERVEVRGEAVPRYLEWRREVDLEQQQSPMDQVARDVLAGHLPSNEIYKARRWDTSSVQDYVVLMGQGTIADREHEHLGREDMGIVLLRQIWTRELCALAEGRPLKEWSR